MPDLGDRLRDYIDGAADPITLDEVTSDEVVLAETRVDPTPLARGGCGSSCWSPQPRSTRPAPDPPRKVVTGTTVPESVAWLTPFGPEEPMPDVPAGWKLVDYEAIRFAVPGSWTVVPACSGPVPATDVAVVPAWQGWVDHLPRTSPSRRRVERQHGERSPRAGRAGR